MSELDLEREYYRLLGWDHPSTEEYWRKLVEPEEREVRSLFSREILHRLNSITSPHDHGRGMTDVLFKLGLWVWAARSKDGDIYETMRSRRNAALDILPRVRANLDGLRGALRQASDLDLIQGVDEMLDALADLSDGFSPLEQFAALPSADGNPGLRLQHKLVIQFAGSWHLTTGEPPKVSISGTFQRYVDTMLELIPIDCRPRWIAPATVRGWAADYKKQVKDLNFIFED